MNDIECRCCQQLSLFEEAMESACAHPCTTRHCKRSCLFRSEEFTSKRAPPRDVVRVLPVSSVYHGCEFKLFFAAQRLTPDLCKLGLQLKASTALPYPLCTRFLLALSHGSFGTTSGF